MPIGASHASLLLAQVSLHTKLILSESRTVLLALSSAKWLEQSQGDGNLLQV